MTDLDAQIAAVLALDEKRTPGPYHLNDRDPLTVLTSQSHLLCTLSDPFDRQCEWGTGEDAAFIAAAPLMASIIRQLAAERAADAADARRYRWLRTRINWSEVEVHRLNIVSHFRRWSHVDYRPYRPASEHIDDYIDASIRALDAAITSAGGTTDE